MGQVRHGSATTTHAIRAAIQRSHASLATLSRELGINPKTVNRTIKEATVKRFHYDNHDQLRTHLDDFIAAYNFARRLKTLNGLTPYEYICKVWTSEPDRFIVNPIHQMPGLNMSMVRDIAGEDTDLAIGDLACGSGVLACHATGRVALLQKAGLINLSAASE